jgi:hypothetical protein
MKDMSTWERDTFTDEENGFQPKLCILFVLILLWTESQIITPMK